MNTVKIDSGRVRFIAHRGLSGLEKENTCAAFVAAGNRDGIFGIETDVHRTGDGRYLLFHDDNTQRVGLDRLVLEESTFETLRGLRLTDLDGARGRGDLMMPTVEEYLGICKRYEKTCVFEFKNPMPAEDIRRLTDLFREADYLDRTIFISFRLENLIALREYCPEASAQYLLEHWNDDALDQLKKYRLGLDIKWTALTEEIVEEVHRTGKPVNCWTVNAAEDARRMMDMGVDFITTNILEKL